MSSAPDRNGNVFGPGVRQAAMLKHLDKKPYLARIDALAGDYFVSVDPGSGAPDMGCALVCKRTDDGKLHIMSISLVPIGSQTDPHALVLQRFKEEHPDDYASLRHPLDPRDPS